MDLIEELKQDHADIERELIELEEIIQCEEINYSNLLHIYKRLIKLWDSHEEKEENIFPLLEKEEIKIPVETMMFAHRTLRPHKEAIKNAINSGSEFELKRALNEDGLEIIKNLREHMNKEDEILFRITLDLFSPDELKELSEKNGK